MLSIRRATANDTVEIEKRVADFVKGHPAENHPLSGKAFQAFAKLDGLPIREIVRRLPAKALGLQPPD